MFTFQQQDSIENKEVQHNPDFIEIEKLDIELLNHFANKIIVKEDLNRKIVSFQANKNLSSYRWYKYKEAFSSSLIEYLLQQYHIQFGNLLDPFAGSGTSLFAASELGLDTDGIELLPIGQEIIKSRLVLEKEFTKGDFDRLIHWSKKYPWENSILKQSLNELRITRGAYPEETLNDIEQYLGTLHTENERVQIALQFILLCVLESISYTRKDGQYLRWDHRSGRQQGNKPFDKGKVLNFRQAICDKLSEILNDLHTGNRQGELFSILTKPGKVSMFKGSSLDIMPNFQKSIYDVVITSPPYCNRYDYTRTYALELALLGIRQEEIVNLRQQMLSCTVENRPKNLLAINAQWSEVIAVTDQQKLLQAILQFLEKQKLEGKLNNSGIPRMIKGYFYEMACIIAECYRVMKPNALLFMVNDNVRYAGVSISVDLILSNIAEKMGFQVENILVLPTGKGNSSQQMGEHGRDTLRKCIYVWRKV
ncbi:MAG TPA: site-specific DNA-methyltransferase [Nostocaceae cyanobacterium]|nr:site-specific DNA-methyltransferase [Nostocaceae cyanobacterium]